MHSALLFQEKDPFVNLLYSQTSPENRLPIFSVLIYTSHYSMFQKFHEQRETWRVSAEKAEERKGGGKQSQACAASDDSITTPVKDPSVSPSSQKPGQRASKTDRERERKREKARESWTKTKHRERRDETE